MERSLERRPRGWSGTPNDLFCANANVGAGPAHAVYFASYEAVKHYMGGNEGGVHEHHPLAAGMTTFALGERFG